jgi:hypothetical protein
MQVLQSEISHKRLHDLEKKSWLEIVSEPAPRHPCPHIKLVMIVVMIPMVAVVTLPVIWASRIAVVPIGPIVSIRIIAVSVARIAVIAVPIAWTKPNSD